MRRTWLDVGAVIAALLVAPAAAAGDDQTRENMSEIFEALQAVLPLSLSDEKFRDPAHRETIRAQLATLANDGARLEAHGRSRDAGFKFLSRSLARDTREIQRRYDEGRISEARFLLHQLTDDCVACHSRLPSDRDSPLAELFVEEETIATLSLDERARLEVATRQFDRALASHEALFASPDASPGSLDLTRHFDDYLEVAIRVRRDPARARRALEKFSQRTDLSGGLRSNLAAWITSLRELEATGLDGDELARARQLVLAARDARREPNSRATLVTYTAASSLLHRYVTEQPAYDPGLPEAYYLLGAIEARVGRAFWLSQTEFFLETCIRLAPQGPYAQGAFDLLEEFMVSGYTGSAGERVPQEVRSRLEELWQLIHGEAETPAPDPARPPGGVEPGA